MFQKFKLMNMCWSTLASRLSRIDEAEARLVFDFLETMNQLDELSSGDEAGGGAETVRAGPGRDRPPDPGPSVFPSDSD